MSEVTAIHPGNGSFVVNGRAYHFCVTKVASTSFTLTRETLTYETAPTSTLDTDAVFASGISIEMLDSIYVVWIYYSYSPTLKRRVWYYSLLRTTSDGVLKTVTATSENASTEGGANIPRFESSEENHLFWTFSKDAADAVFTAAAADPSADKSSVRKTYGFQKMRFVLGEASLRDLVLTQIPHLARAQSLDILSGAQLTNLFASGTANTTTFDANHYYVIAHRPDIALLHYFELTRMDYLAVMWENSWSVSAVSEFGALYEKATDRAPLATLHERLCLACSPFGADAADIAEEIRMYVQQCAEGIYRVVLRDEKAIADTTGAERVSQVLEWRKKVLSSLGHDAGMAIAAALLKANGIAFQNVMLTNLTSVNPLISPLSILAKIRDICTEGMSYFDAYFLSLESRQRYADAIANGAIPWYFSVPRMRGRVTSETARLRDQVQANFAKSGGLVNFMLDVALRCKPGDAEVADLVNRFTDVMTSWGIDWWTGIPSTGVSDETIKGILSACSGLGDAVKSAAESALKNYGEELLLRLAKQAGTGDALMGQLASLGAGLLGLEATFGSAVAIPMLVDTVVTTVPGVPGAGAVALAVQAALGIPLPLKHASCGSIVLGTVTLPVRYVKLDPRILRLSAAARERSPAGSELLNLDQETAVLLELAKSVPSTTTVDAPSYCSDLFGLAKYAIALERLSLAAQNVATPSIPCIPWIRLADGVGVTATGLGEAVLIALRNKSSLGSSILGVGDKLGAGADVFPMADGEGVELTVAAKSVLDANFATGDEIVGDRIVGSGTVAMIGVGATLGKAMVSLDLAAPGLALGPMRWLAVDFQSTALDGGGDPTADLERLDAAIEAQFSTSEVGAAFDSLQGMVGALRANA